LQHHGQGLRHNPSSHGSARASSDGSTYSFPYAAAHATAHTTTYAAAHTTAYIATNTSSTFWPSGPIQLRCGCRNYLGSRQESVVLQSAPSRVPSHRATTSTDLATSAANLATGDANNATSPGGPIQLCGWICELAGRMECAEKGMVLQSAR